MGGLLYKDYVSARVLRVLIPLIIATVIYLVLRMIFPGWNALPDMMVTNDNGEVFNMVDMIFIMIAMAAAIYFPSFTNLWLTHIAKDDEKNNIHNYISSLPLGPNAYVASKFIFIGISAYVFLSISAIWDVIAAYSVENEAVLNMASFLPVLTLAAGLISLFISAIELPVFILLGKEKATFITTGILIVLVMAVFWYLFFGKIPNMEDEATRSFFDLIFKWFKEHQYLVAWISALSVVIVTALYFGSYKLTAWLFAKKNK